MRVARRALVLTACLGVMGAPFLAGAAPPPPGIHIASFKAPSSVKWRDRAAISGSVAPAAAGLAGRGDRGDVLDQLGAIIEEPLHAAAEARQQIEQVGF